MEITRSEQNTHKRGITVFRFVDEQMRKLWCRFTKRRVRRCRHDHRYYVSPTSQPTGALDSSRSSRGVEAGRDQPSLTPSGCASVAK